MKHLALILLCLSISPSHAILGDLNLDGRVSFDDFFIFADNFGKSGPVDTLRVEVFDTTFVEQTVEVFDTTRAHITVEVLIFDTTFVTLFDTVTVADPTPGRYTTQNQIENLVDDIDPLDGMRVVDIQHGSTELRLGPGLERRSHSHMQVTFFEEGQVIDRVYLKPSGHVLEENTRSYTVEMIASSEGQFEFWLEWDGFQGFHPFYFFSGIQYA